MYIIFMLVRTLTLWYYSLIMIHLSSICTSFLWNVSLLQLFPLTRTTDFLLFFFFFLSPVFSFHFQGCKHFGECQTDLSLASSFSTLTTIPLASHLPVSQLSFYTRCALSLLCICDHVGFDDSTLPITAHSCRSFPMAFS